MMDMSKAFDGVERGIVIVDLIVILEDDERNNDQNTRSRCKATTVIPHL